MKKALSIDIGGTKICYAIIDENGDYCCEPEKVATPKVAQEIFSLLSSLAQKYDSQIDAIGLATAGAVNSDNTRVVSSTPNLPSGYNSLDFSKISSKKVFVENDANAAAWAEYKLGAAKGCDYNITVTLGTGIGTGIINEGKLLRGKSGAGGESGSMKIFADKRQKCTCGRFDCWESYASGTGLRNCIYNMTLSEPEFSDSIFKDKLPSELTTYDVIEGVRKDDSFCKKVFAQWVEYLFVGIVNLVNIFDPQCVVISGGMGEFIDVNELENRVNSEIVVQPVKIRLAEMKNNAGMIGAALLALQ